MDYYKLPEDERWLAIGDSPYNIGGYSTDIEYIGYALQSRIKEIYPVNQVPLHIAQKLEALVVRLEFAAKEIEEFLEIVTDNIAGIDEPEEACECNRPARRPGTVGTICAKCDKPVRY